MINLYIPTLFAYLVNEGVTEGEFGVVEEVLFLEGIPMHINMFIQYYFIHIYKYFHLYQNNSKYVIFYI
jgi:hypothetical protein